MPISKFIQLCCFHKCIYVLITKVYAWPGYHIKDGLPNYIIHIHILFAICSHIVRLVLYFVY